MKATDATDKTTNGTVTLELEISDPVMEAGIETRLTGIESEKEFVTQRLADHVRLQHDIDLEEFGIDVRS